jgi:hypothetical protein
LRVSDAVEATAAGPGVGPSVGLDICCTTSVFVDGIGDFGDSCVQLGNGTRSCELKIFHCQASTMYNLDEPVIED